MNMKRAEYRKIDMFRMIAAGLIVAIHTAPFSSINETMDYVITYCLGRIGVPFFLMVTGYFVLAPYYSKEEDAVGKVKKYLIKMLQLYGVSIMLYLPVNIYSGQLPESFGEAAKQLVFDGTFYHLWYLPAVILGTVFFIVLMKAAGNKWTGAVSVLLYLIGMLGDSCYGLVSQIPVAETIYEAMFQISSYTRNGIFFVPVFLWLGMNLGRGKLRFWEKSRFPGNVGQAPLLATALGVSAAAMVAEGFLTWYFELQRHNSMYLFLLPVMLFLFQLLACEKWGNGEGRRDTRSGRRWELKNLRGISMWIYIIHPICIIVVRGCAKVIKQQSILVDNSLVHYLVVCMGSVAGAAILYWLETKGKKALSCIKKDGHGWK